MSGNLPGASEVEALLQPYLESALDTPSELFTQLAEYLELLVKWNAQTNLTAIREPAQIVRRHFGESLFAANQIGSFTSLLDFGSGAGFPGLPIQLAFPGGEVTLAESQNKKATFLREVVRTLKLKTEVWAKRTEDMPPGRMFEVVTLRAVDSMDAAIKEASKRTTARLVLFTTDKQLPESVAGFSEEQRIRLPESESGLLVIFRRIETV